MPFDGKNAVQEILTPIQEILDPGSWLCGMVVLADRQTGRQADGRMGKEREHMAKERFVEVYSQGLTNVEKIIVDTETGVNYILASSALTVGCGMSVLVDQDGKPVVTPME